MTDLVPFQGVQQEDRQTRVETCHSQAFPTGMLYDLVIHQIVDDPLAHRPLPCASDPESVADRLAFAQHGSPSPRDTHGCTASVTSICYWRSKSALAFG